MVDSRQTEELTKDRKVTIGYRCVPNSLIAALFAASIVLFGLLATQLAPVVDHRIYPTDFRTGYSSPAQTSSSSFLWSLAQELGNKSSIANADEYVRAQLFYFDTQPYPEPIGHGEVILSSINPEQLAWISEGRFQDELEASLAIQEMHYIFACSTLLLLAGLCLLLELRLKDRRLLIDSNGLRFPSGMVADLGLKLSRTWDDLSAIGLSGGSNTAKHLEIYFASGGKASIATDRLSRSDLEKLFSAMDLHAPHIQRSPDLVVFRQTSLNCEKDPSFTQLWEEELQSRFAATNFVALTQGSRIQNGRIKISMHISSGGLSAVYLAERNKSMVVLKESVVPASTSEANRIKAKEMFAREASMLMKLSHPQIAKVIDYFQENERDYLLIEYVPGVTLREYVRRHGSQPEKRVADWSIQIAQLLQYLHEQDPPVIHRDLTPDNLMITPSGQIVLIDFGAANQYLGTATGTIIGKQFYISPEQFRGKAVPSSDIYSLGGTMHFLLTGNDPDALSISHPVRQAPNVSEQMDRIVANCTEIDLSKRVESASQLIQVLNEHLHAKDAQILETAYESSQTVSIKKQEKQAR